MTDNNSDSIGARPSREWLGPPYEYGVTWGPMTDDPRTGRPFGDHGTAAQALEFALDGGQPYTEVDTFLRAWREGALDEWSEFYTWLATQPTGEGSQS